MVFFILLNGARIKWHYKETALAFYIFLEVKSPGTFFHPESLLHTHTHKYQRSVQPCACSFRMVFLSALIFTQLHVCSLKITSFLSETRLTQLRVSHKHYILMRQAMHLFGAFLSDELCKLGSRLWLNKAFLMAALMSVVWLWGGTIFFYAKPQGIST